MKFSQFQSSIYGRVLDAPVDRHTSFRGHQIVESVDGKVFVDAELSEYESLEEAVGKLDEMAIQEEIYREIQQESYSGISDLKVADIIHKHHAGIRVTDTLVESYVELASSKMFTIDPVVTEIRKTNSLDRVVEGHLDFKLNDGSVIVISEEVQQRLNNIFEHHFDVAEYMRESKENFLSVINQLEE